MNQIDFNYGPWNGDINSDLEAAIGIKNTLGSNFVFLNGRTGSNTDQSRFKNKVFPITGTILRFTP